MYNKPAFYNNLTEYKQIHFNNWDNVLNDIYVDLKKLVQEKKIALSVYFLLKKKPLIIIMN